MTKLEKIKSLEQIENDYWEDIEYPTLLVQKCYELRKKRLADLEANDLRILISQNIGLKILIPIAIDFLQVNILIEGKFYPGDLLECVLARDCDFWIEYQNSWIELKEIFNKKEKEIKESSLINNSIKDGIFDSYQKFSECIS